MRDGYAGYTHLTDALHAWCGAHLLRDLAAYHRADPDTAGLGQSDGRPAHRRPPPRPEPPAPPATSTSTSDVLTDLRRRYLGAYTAGIRDNQNRAGPLAKDAAALARRFRDHQDMILRFVVDLAVPFTNNQAERDLRPVKIQQRTSGGTWRTLAGLADFAVVQSYLSTARKWGIDSHRRPHPTVHHRRLATTRRRTLLNSYAAGSSSSAPTSHSSRRIVRSPGNANIIRK